MKRRELGILSLVLTDCNDMIVGKRWPPPSWFVNEEVISNDLTIGPGSNKLAYWHRAEEGVTLDSAMLRSGTGTGTVVLSGDLSQIPVNITVPTAGQVGGTLAIYHAFDENGADRTGPVAVTTETVDLGLGRFATFQAGVNYTTDNRYRSVMARWEPKFGPTGTAGGRLDNLTVTPSPGPVYEAHGIETAHKSRASILLAPALIGNQGAFAAAIDGNVSFHHFCLAEISPTLPNTTAVHTLLGWFSQTIAGSHLIDLLVTGTTNPTPFPPNVWNLQRINSAGTPERYSSDGSTGGFAAVQPDLNSHIFEIEYNPPNVILRVDGYEVATGVWTGSVTINRVCFGGAKSGGGVATAFANMRMSDSVLYLPALSTAEANSVRMRMA